MHAIHCLRLSEVYCNSLHLTAPRCNALQLTAIHCNSLQHTVTHCSTLSRHACYSLSETFWSLLQVTAIHCNSLQFTATHCNTSNNYARIHHLRHSEIFVWNHPKVRFPGFCFLFLVAKKPNAKIFATSSRFWCSKTIWECEKTTHTL